MTFDPIRFAQELLGLAGQDEVLACARQAATAASGQPVVAAYLPPGRTWDHASIQRPEDHGADGEAPSLAAARSALFAVHRRLSLVSGTLRLLRTEETEPIFRALQPQGSTALVAVPMRNRHGVAGALVTAWPGDAGGAAWLGALDAIAALVAPALEVAGLHRMAHRNQERLQLFSETTNESLWDWDVTLGEVWWGGNLELIFGGRARVSRRPDWRATRIHAEDTARVIASFEAALAGDESSWNQEYRLRGIDDDVIHVREHVYFLREVSGRAYRAIGTVSDISALQLLLRRETHARAAAEHASVVKDEFLAMLGHELRNPLAPIVSVLSLLERRSDGPDPQLAILRRQTQHLVRLVDDLLDVSRISSGKVELDRQRVPVGPLVQRALEMARPLLEERRHRVMLDLAPGLDVDADATRMTQVLANLLANAAKYTEPCGRVEVRAAAEDGDVTIRIRDNGIGISPEFLPKIFDLFTQSRQALDRAQGGLGLGLSIVKNIVKLHGGSVHAYSAGIGLGAEVVVRLPPAAAPVATAPTPATAEPPGARPRRLLVVDDNADAAEVLQELLSLSGHAVQVAHHPRDALRLFAQGGLDLALVDIGLPSMDGYELVRRLRALPGGAQARFVALTGYGLASDKAKAAEAGFDAHLVKPVALDRLEAVIEALTSGQAVS